MRKQSATVGKTSPAPTTGTVHGTGGFYGPLAPVAKQHFRADGQDDVEFYIQTNPGERMGPLAKIASGGELSRVMLALKTIFAQGEGVTSIIFDEVDTGVSGRVAQAIADKIKVIAQKSQVLCISHLPQVAAVAQHHFLIQKQVHNERTNDSVTPQAATNRRVGADAGGRHNH